MAREIAVDRRWQGLRAGKVGPCRSVSLAATASPIAGQRGSCAELHTRHNLLTDSLVSCIHSLNAEFQARAIVESGDGFTDRRPEFGWAFQGPRALE
jgi:hypothetical protein